MRRAVLLGQELQRIRQEKELTLDELGRSMSRRGKPISRGYLSGIENAKVGPPSERLLRRLAEVLEIPAERLLLLACLDKLPPELFDVYPAFRTLRDEAAAATDGDLAVREEAKTTG